VNIYLVRYSGLWLGGEAFVFADNESEALEKVKNDKRTSNFTEVKVKKVESSGVFYNNNGDY